MLSTSRHILATLLVGTALSFAAASQAQAGLITLTFADLPNEVTIGNYFNGGLSGFPASGTGPSDNITFSPNAEELKDTVGRTTGTGKFENNPSGLNGVLYFAFSSTSGAFLNDKNGFSGISFDYSLLDNMKSLDTVADIWSGLNGTGKLLGTLTLDAAGTTVGCATHTNEFCTWSAASLKNLGVGKSITFGSNNITDEIEFDDIALTPVPEPASWTLLLAGLLGMTLLYRGRKSA